MLTKERRSFVYGSWRVKLVAEEMKLGNTVYVKVYNDTKKFMAVGSLDELYEKVVFNDNIEVSEDISSLPKGLKKKINNVAHKMLEKSYR